MIRRHLAHALRRWDRRARIVRDFLAYEAPRRIRVTRAAFNRRYLASASS